MAKRTNHAPRSRHAQHKISGGGGGGRSHIFCAAVVPTTALDQKKLKEDAKSAVRDPERDEDKYK